MPLVHRLDPGKNLPLAIGCLGGGDGAARWNLAGSVAPLAGEGGRGKEELTMARFGPELGSARPPVR
jgi:hypothetical protein